MSDMRKLLESMTKFAGEPAQRPGDQVRGTERAVKKKSGDHPFQGRLVGEDNIFKELEKQLVEGDVERRLREEFEQFNEFAPDDGDSGGEDDALRNYARMWWAGDEATQQQIEKVLARMGWEIGEDEGGYDNGGVFVVRAGDENGNSYQSWAAEDLTEGVAEATGDKKFDSMMSQMTSEPKYPDQDMPPTSVPELLQWADTNNKPYHEYFAQWARRNKFTNVNDALVWFGDNVDPSNPWGPKDFVDPFGRPAAEELEDAAKHDPKAAELMKVFRCYEEIVFDWPDEYRQMNMPTSRKGTDEGVAEGRTIVPAADTLTGAKKIWQYVNRNLIDLASMASFYADRNETYVEERLANLLKTPDGQPIQIAFDMSPKIEFEKGTLYIPVGVMERYRGMYTSSRFVSDVVNAIESQQDVAEGLDNKENPNDQVRNKLNAWMEQDQQFTDPTQRAPFQSKVWPYIQQNIKTILADKGEKGNGDYPAAPYAAWLLVQHMDAYPQNQIEFYNALKQAIPNHPKIQFLRDRAAVNQWIMKNANNPEYFINGKALPNPTVNVRNPDMFKDAGIVATSREEALQNAQAAGNKLLVAAVQATNAQTQPSYKQGAAEGIFGFGTKVPTKDKVEPADDFSAKLLDRRQKQQTQAPKEKVYRGPEEYRQEKEKDVEEGIFGFMSKPEPVKKKEPPDAFADKLDAQRIKNLTQHKPTLADKKKPNVRVITRYTEENVTENEGDPEGLPHLTKELLTHIVDQVGKEGAHAIVKSLTWGDGAAKELLHLIVNDLEDDIQQGLEKQNYKKSPDRITELGANNPPQPTAAVAGNPAQTAPAQPVDPKAAAALKQNLMKLKTSVPGLDITKATTAMTKADTGVPLTPGDKNITSAIAPQLANVMKNPQMASSLKMMIDKANQQEKAAAAKPPGTV